MGSELSQAVVVALSDTDPAVPSPDRFIATIAGESTCTFLLRPRLPNDPMKTTTIDGFTINANGRVDFGVTASTGEGFPVFHGLK